MRQCSMYRTGNGDEHWMTLQQLWYCEAGEGVNLTCPAGAWLGTWQDPPGTECSNCSLALGTACACRTWTPAQVYDTSKYSQQLSTASEAVSLTFAPVTQARDDAGNVYGVANEWASVAVNGSFTH
jgi:hypothetical protein